ncbi:hypothetical protein [Desulfomonile tiedjei]|uniref:Uncharacterized protein n=1 Tax=Desulfomonile tiedjei (strain ATCC 49306 / DSM 6799 / DCB-1) TaxID=706587 RepID=I4C799_DESTA|nr:hypothetical protein [Desulfomonile tiedjei]AFM25440.1 hypothetical protein Desti_2764 [Desulfomonile tiedjei DSM 6799]
MKKLLMTTAILLAAGIMVTAFPMNSDAFLGPIWTPGGCPGLGGGGSGCSSCYWGAGSYGVSYGGGFGWPAGGYGYGGYGRRGYYGAGVGVGSLYGGFGWGGRGGRTYGGIGFGW